ncbi:MAG: helix-turn-helix transcriptional regulator [Armatimonadetes bacterium]|nr:helix-turn-helix transcriptional regulator [Armatimonadota bacterium]
MGAIGVPAKRWATRAEIFHMLEKGRALLASDPRAGVAEAATAAGMSHEHFVRNFQEAYGSTPREFAARSRLEMARGLLESSSFEISAVAFASGYDDASSFARAFKRQFGRTPREHRKLSNSAQ